MKTRYVTSGLSAAFAHSIGGWDGDLGCITLYECELTADLASRIPMVEAGLRPTLDINLKRGEVEVRNANGELLLHRSFHVTLGEAIPERAPYEPLPAEVMDAFPSMVGVEIPCDAPAVRYGVVRVGQRGYIPVTGVLGLDALDAKVQADYGCAPPTPQQRKAALQGSIHGWYAPSAHPEHPANQ